jgi:hypothetical protein
MHFFYNLSVSYHYVATFMFLSSFDFAVSSSFDICLAIIVSFWPIVWTSYREFCFFRFHLLAEFDDAKRSCRKRLDGHNRRRRKPQPDTMNSGSFMTSQQGILGFCSASNFFC